MAVVLGLRALVLAASRREELTLLGLADNQQRATQRPLDREQVSLAGRFSAAREG